MKRPKRKLTKPIGAEPLDGIEDELSNAIRRDIGRSKQRRVRQRVLVVAASFLTVGVVATAGAGAGIFPSTDLGVVDDLLGNWQVNRDPQGHMARPSMVPRWRQLDGMVDVRPMGGSTSGVLTVPGAAASAVTSRFISYASRDGSVCFAAVPTGSQQPDSQNAIACQSMPNVANELASRPAYVAGLRAGSPAIVSGFAAVNVENIDVVGPSGPLAVRLSDPWKPDVPDAVELRSFVAFQPSFLDSLEPSRQQQEQSAGGDLRQFRIRARLDDGQTVDGS